MSIQEAVPVDSSPHLSKLFSVETIGCLPRSGHDRVRRTTLGLLGLPTGSFPFLLLTNCLSYIQERTLRGSQLSPPRPRQLHMNRY